MKISAYQKEYSRVTFAIAAFVFLSIKTMPAFAGKTEIPLVEKVRQEGRPAIVQYLNATGDSTKIEAVLADGYGVGPEQYEFHPDQSTRENCQLISTRHEIDLLLEEWSSGNDRYRSTRLDYIDQLCPKQKKIFGKTVSVRSGLMELLKDLDAAALDWNNNLAVQFPENVAVAAWTQQRTNGHLRLSCEQLYSQRGYVPHAAQKGPDGLTNTYYGVQIDDWTAEDVAWIQALPKICHEKYKGSTAADYSLLENQFDETIKNTDKIPLLVETTRALESERIKLHQLEVMRVEKMTLEAEAKEKAAARAAENEMKVAIQAKANANAAAAKATQEAGEARKACISSTAYKRWIAEGRIVDALDQVKRGEAALKQDDEIAKVSGVNNLVNRQQAGEAIVNGREIIRNWFPDYQALGGAANSPEKISLGANPCI